MIPSFASRANARLAGLPKPPPDSDDSADQRSLRSVENRTSPSSRSTGHYGEGRDEWSLLEPSVSQAAVRPVLLSRSLASARIPGVQC